MKVTDRAPALVATDHRGQAFDLSRFRGRSAVVVFFYPRDDTPICTKEACAFQELSVRFAALDAVVVGVSADSLAKHRAFAERHRLEYPLLSDSDGTWRAAFGVRKRWGIIPARETFVIDREGVIRAVVRDLFSHQRHVDVAVETLRALSDEEGESV